MTATLRRAIPTAELAAGILAGDRRAVARGLSVIERGGAPAHALVDAIHPSTGRARIAGFTGPPGAGKSTLVGAVTAALRGAGRRVAVAAVDPSSPYSSGALLGDRIRMQHHDEDPGVYVRSLASRGLLGGLARAVPGAVAVLDAAGFDDVLIETVGVGQSEIEIVGNAETVVLVLMPGAGDETQMIKAGIMEIPDVIVVNRADDDRARAFAKAVRRVVRTTGSGRPAPPVLLTQATSGDGVEEVVAALAAHRAGLDGSGQRSALRRERLRRAVVELAVEEAARELRRRAGDPEFQRLLDQLDDGRCTPTAAARWLSDPS